MPNENGRINKKDIPKEKSDGKSKRTKSEKTICVDDLRHAEYYAMQEVFDDLYARSKRREEFTDLMQWILHRENILLAYRNIKTNSGSGTPGTDGITIGDIGRLTPDEVVIEVRRRLGKSQRGYVPKAVRRVDIPKPNGSTRPLGIPCMWDRLIQQCIKQVMEPICEAKFSENSYGFRPDRSAENAILATYNRLQLSKLHYCIEFDIKGFFDNVDHTKLIRQIWAMGIHDKHLIYIIRQILTAKIKMPDGAVVTPAKGTPQGGIISPLLANIVLNELDHWVDQRWQDCPVTKNYEAQYNKKGSENKGHAFRAMRTTKLKEMYIVRYADDFRILCRTKTDAVNTKAAITMWLRERLKLEVSAEKTRIVNVKRKNSEFLGFKIRLRSKSGKYVVVSHICDKGMQRTRQQLVQQAKRIAKPRKRYGESGEIRRFNAMVMGKQNYYRIATNVSADCGLLNRAVMTVLTNRLKTQKGNRLKRNGQEQKPEDAKRLKRVGRKLTPEETKRYGKSAMLRYVAGSGEPIYPIGYVQHKNPMNKKRSICRYTAEGRVGLHDDLCINTALQQSLMRQPSYGKSAEYADNRISLFSAQYGKCAVTGADFQTVEEIHCHHKIPRTKGGTDKYENLTLVLEPVHKLIHATRPETIAHYLNLLQLDKKQMAKLNKLRLKAENAEIKGKYQQSTDSHNGKVWSNEARVTTMERRVR